jgi:PadR family transcriptional regulator, regulatory protein PadR
MKESIEKNNQIDRCSCKNARSVRFLIPALLLLIREGPSHGYELMDKYAAFNFTDAGSDPGAIYRTLNVLESEDYILSQWDTKDPGPAKKIYSITDKGIGLLAEWAKEIEARIDIFALFLSRYKKIK